MTTPRIGYVVVAAGRGERLGADQAKAFVAVRGEAMLTHALRPLQSLPVGPVSVVVPLDAIRSTLRIVKPLGIQAAVTAGGATRAESVANGLAAIASAGGADIVLVHDAARPFTPVEVFERVIAEVAQSGDGVVPALAVVDTVKSVDADGVITGSPDRASLRAVQTPQGFPFAALVAANEQLGDAVAELTDDAAVFAAAGHRVCTVAGDANARKITTADDLEWANGLQHAQRSGIGVDAHAFSVDPAAELWLAGLHWPGEPGLEGHSDGDVACHALVDALLGAAGLGDIGGLFGTADPQFAGARGEVFLREARSRVEAAGWHITNASVEIVGNRPKLAARRAEAEALLGSILGAPVNLAATTTDGLGLSGEGRGIGAIATVSLR
ncbi:MAG: 2-C-methyl-D-erythritol 4-phosphate cytidylyltransferase [Microbacteriaceae bacterium]